MSSNQDSPQHSPGESDGSPQPAATYARTSCDLCKRMKIKCEKQGDSCVHCIDRGAVCETTYLKRKKQVKRGNHLLDVESRIKRLESVLTASGIDAHFGENADESTELPQDFTDRLSYLVIDETRGSSRFLGASSGFSLFSPQGLQWISERTGSNDLSKFISKLSRAGKGSETIVDDDLWYPIPESQREPLPSKDVADQYVNHFFDTFGSVFPLYDEKDFREKYELQYSGEPVGGISWYASLNVVLSMGCMILRVHVKAKGIGSPPRDSGDSHKYFHNASSCLVDLMFKNCDLMAIQTLCGLAFIQQMRMEPQALHVVTATACRLAYGMGLHRKLDDFGLSDTEINQRRNVFWILYFIDKSVALRAGHPSIMHDDDIGVDLPQEAVVEKWTDGSLKYFIFRISAKLSLLESRIYSELYSIRARNKSARERLKSVGQLDKDLQEWRLAIPIEIRPGEPMNCSEKQLVPVSMMHFSYLNCLSTIHRASIHHGSWTVDSASQNDGIYGHQINPRVYASQSICLTAARSSIQLLQEGLINEDSGNFDFIWLALHYPLSGFLTLFANTLQNPQDPCVVSDLQLMYLVTTFLSPVVQVSPFPATTAITIFQELYKVATQYVEKTNSLHMKGMKRDRDDRDAEEGGWTPSSQGTQKTTGLAYPNNVEIFDRMAPPPYYMPMPATIGTDPSNFNIDPQQNDGYQHFSSQPQYFDGINSAAANQFSVTNNPSTYPAVGSELPLFSEHFEFDLANLWNLDFMQGSS